MGIDDYASNTQFQETDEIGIWTNTYPVCSKLFSLLFSQNGISLTNMFNNTVYIILNTLQFSLPKAITHSRIYPNSVSCINSQTSKYPYVNSQVFCIFVTLIEVGNHPKIIPQRAPGIQIPPHSSAFLWFSAKLTTGWTLLEVSSVRGSEHNPYS